MTARASFDDRLREAQELNAASQARPASHAFRALLRDLSPLDPVRHGRWVVEVRVRALLGEAFCVHALTGDIAAAHRLAGEALAEAEAEGARELVALAYGQSGLLHLRSGDLLDAIAAFDRALADADPANHRDLAVLRINRGAAWGEAGEQDRAIEDYQLALQDAVAAGQDRYVSFLHHNIGMARFERGDLPGAIEAMDQNSGGTEGWSEAGRAAVLIGAGLVTEAEKVLADSASLLEAEGLLAERADALCERARCALLLGRFDEAVELAELSRREHRRAENLPWSLHAAVVGLQARLGRDRTHPAPITTLGSEARDLASQADRAGPAAREVAITARLVAAECALLLGEPSTASEVLAETPTGLVSASLAVRVHHQSVRAQVAFAVGDRRTGLTAVRRGHRMLADHRARVGSVDAVTAAAAHGVRLARVDVEAALRTGRARAVFDAVERGRAVFAGAARVRPPDDPEMAELLSMARRAAEESRQLALEPSEEARLAAFEQARRARRYQEQARRRSWRLVGSADLVPRPATARDVVGRLRAGRTDAVVVSYLLGEHVTAVRVDASGARLVELGPVREVTELVRRVRQDLEVLANGLIPPPMRAAAATSARRSAQRLDDLLLAPLAVTGELQVAARDMLLAVPWLQLPSRAGRATRVDTWVDLRPVSASTPRRSAFVVAGPDLANSAREAHLVAETWEEADVLAGAGATCAATIAALSGPQVVHMAAHGVHEPENPLFSFVRLADGPLYAYELDGLDLSGAVVVLSSCEVGRTSSRIDREPLGLTSVLLRLGARAVVAATGPLRDDVAVRVMPRLHAALRDGADPATALVRAVEPEDEPVPLTCFGPLDVAA